jgi:hypothetical protein
MGKKKLTRRHEERRSSGHATITVIYYRLLGIYSKLKNELLKLANSALSKILDNF